MRRIVSVLMENEAGSLSRVVGLFSQRGYNIDSLTVAPTDDETLSRLTLTVDSDDKKITRMIIPLGPKVTSGFLSRKKMRLPPPPCLNIEQKHRPARLKKTNTPPILKLG